MFLFTNYSYKLSPKKHTEGIDFMALAAFRFSQHEVLLCLQNCYQDATRKNGLIDFTKQVRGEKNKLIGKYSIKQSHLTKLFSETVWSVIPTKDGHRKLKNIVTSVIIEYSNHAKDIDPGAAQDILNKVQQHLNILRNDIFAKTWKEEPDYQDSVKRWSPGEALG